MIELLDDHYHVRQACTLLDQNPDRKLISALHCMLGESPDASRLLALLLTVAMGWLVVLLCRQWIPSRQARLMAPWIIGLHPMVAFGWIYPSQLSTTITCLWAFAWYGIWQWVRSPDSRGNVPLRVGLGLAWSCLAIWIRMEAWVYAWLVWGFFWLLELEFSPSESEVRRTPNKTRLLWLGVASLPALIRPQWVGFLLSVFRDDQVAQGIPGLAPTLNDRVTASGESLTQLWLNWTVTQSYAAWLYLRNALIPHLHTFYGPWQRAWQIRENWEQAFWPTLTSCTLAGGALLYRGLRTRRWVLGVIIFLVPTLLLSAVPRTDWYYPARQMLGTTLLLLWLVLNMGSSKVLPKLLLAGSVSAALFAGTYQYANKQNFNQYEAAINGTSQHPWVPLDLGLTKLSSGEPRSALGYFYEASESFTRSQLQQDSRSGFYWSLALYLLWYSHEKLNEPEHSGRALKALLSASFYPSGLACLQDARVPIEFCLSTELRSNYCQYLKHPTFGMAPRLRPLRAEPCPNP